MKTKLIIDGNAVYEIDEECLQCRDRARQRREQEKKRKEDRKTTEKSDGRISRPE